MSTKETITSTQKLLQTVLLKKLSGCLTISNVEGKSPIQWQLFLGDGNLHYATATANQMERLDCLWKLRATQTELLNPLDFSGSKSEYELLLEWRESQKITLSRLRSLLLNLSQEALNHAFACDRVKLKFEPNVSMKPALIAVPIANLLKQSLVHIQSWQNLSPAISSPFDLISLNSANVDRFCSIWAEKSKDRCILKLPSEAQSLTSWIHLLGEQLSLYGLSSKLGVEPLVLARWLHPMIVDQILEALPCQPKLSTSNLSPHESSANHELSRPLIACIDDSHTVQRQVKLTLERSGYRVLCLTDPANSLTELVRQKPSLILMDINMPEVDGFELCRMLQRSRLLKELPVIMFTGRSGIVDRFRSQLVGAVDYLAKPIEADKLLATVQKLVLPVQSYQEV
jgi:twitching motility two-component system response regulator PilG